MNEKIPNRIPLSALETGRTATVVAVAGSGALRRRLLKELDLPGALSANAMPGVLSRLMTLAQLETEMTRLRGR